MAARQRRWVESFTFGAGALLVFALVVMVNYLSWKYYKRFDWTSEELYTLSEKSKNVVSALSEPIEAVIFMSPGEPLFDSVRELLTRYAAESENLSSRSGKEPGRSSGPGQQVWHQPSRRNCPGSRGRPARDRELRSRGL